MFGDWRWCFPTHRVCRITSNVVVAIHCTSSPWNGRSIKRQVLQHSYYYISCYFCVPMSWSFGSANRRYAAFGHTRSQTPWMLDALYIFFHLEMHPSFSLGVVVAPHTLCKINMNRIFFRLLCCALNGHYVLYICTSIIIYHISPVSLC